MTVSVRVMEPRRERMVISFAAPVHACYRHVIIHSSTRSLMDLAYGGFSFPFLPFLFWVHKTHTKNGFSFSFHRSSNRTTFKRCFLKGLISSISVVVDFTRPRSAATSERRPARNWFHFFLHGRSPCRLLETGTNADEAPAPLGQE